MGRTLQLPTAEVYLPFCEPSRYKGAHGGRGSAKSHEFAKNLLERCVMERGTRWVCVREVQLSLKQSVKRLLEDKIKSFDLGSEFGVMADHIVTPGDGIIIFQGMQNHTAESIKSLEGYNGAWVEEAQSLSQRSLDLLRPTIRVPDSELWFSWNPRHATDPVDKFLRGENVPPGAIVIGSTYRDNPWFPDVLRIEMEYDRRVDPEKYQHIWLGGYERHSEARVFKNWRVGTVDPALLVDLVPRYGGDWGFSVDPTVAVKCYELPALEGSPRKRLYIAAEVHKIGCEIDHTPALFDTLDKGQARLWPLIADSARPETISYLQRHGYPRIQPAVKGPNSVKEGVIFLQNYEIIINPDCTHSIDEFTLYSYVVEKLTGIVTNVLEDKKNHVIDSVRYAVEGLRAGTRRVFEAQWG